jgi:hypothetical protein
VRRPVADEDVDVAIGVVPDKVGGIGGEGDGARVGGDRRAVAGPVRFGPGGADADPSGRVRRPVADEDVDVAIGVVPDNLLAVREAAVVLVWADETRTKV